MKPICCIIMGFVPNIDQKLQNFLIAEYNNGSTKDVKIRQNHYALTGKILISRQDLCVKMKDNETIRAKEKKRMVEIETYSYADQ